MLGIENHAKIEVSSVSYKLLQTILGSSLEVGLSYNNMENLSSKFKNMSKKLV
jgi:hypothetical protein